MCTKQLILEQWRDRAGVFHSHYFAHFVPEIHNEVFLRKLSLRHNNHKFVIVPCGKCADCIRKAARDWKIRLYHEAQITSSCIFLTLTYNNDNLPSDGNLHYDDFQKFMKRLRRKLPKGHKITYFVACEYGTKTFRPHFHAIIYDLPLTFLSDSKFFCTSRSDKRIKIYRSPAIEKIWNKGYCSFTKVEKRDPRAFGYVSGYLISKKNKRHFSDVSSRGLTPENHHMSLKPCIGRRYFDKYYISMYKMCEGKTWFDCKLVITPRAYDRWYQTLTESYVICKDLLSSDEWDYYFAPNAPATRSELMHFIFNVLKNYDIHLDKISDFDIIKKKRRKFLSASSTGLRSKEIVLEQSLYSSRDIIYNLED
ncbi:replication initiator protein [Sigmofec virus UA08Rod_6451]|uniref:Replication initiator protein n=1 Tax=Sigmofec virus UA08Rod_6451 TaxID=2929230 RepID=A0A976N0A6_9VIRU|nr:replication initiator protein [Sigmofec virus UA08Rod_6451]